jgi:predicted RNA-binding protein (virulence factor B family)
MGDEELWFAYLDQMAQKAATQQATSPASDAASSAEVTSAKDLKSASPFACEELPPE